MSTEHTPSTNRRNAVIGVGAGLLAGGAIGLMALSPTFTSAASDGSEAALVVQQDAATDTTDDSEDTPTDVTPGERVRELLQELVDDGTITAGQADTIATHLAEHRAEHRGDHGGHGHRGGPGWDGEVVAELLGIDAETLREELMAGNSIADIAESNGVDVQTVIDALVDEAEAHLDLAVESGRLTAEEAEEKLADVTERVTARVNGEGRPDRG